MSEREILLRWLARAAQRLRSSRRVSELGSLACTLLGLLCLYRVVAILGTPAPVLAALAPLFILAALAMIAFFARRLGRRTTLAEAARAADARAELKDELQSAYWFAERPERDPLIALLLTRAAHTAQRLDASRLFPLSMPRSLVAAFGLAILTGALTGLSPRIALSIATHGPQAASAHGASPTARGQAAAENGVQGTVTRLDTPAAARAHRRDLPWSRIAAIAKALPVGADEDGIRRAVAARDAERAARLLQGLQRRQAAAQGAAARPDGEQMSAEVAQGILERLQELLSEDGRGQDDATQSAQPAARVTQQLREEISEEQRRLPGRHSEGEIALNTLLRAISRNSTGEREAASGEGEAGQDSGRTNLNGGAMGRRIGMSRAGAGDSDRAQGNPAGDADAAAVLGQQTTRLEAQLQKVRVERNARPDAGATEESFYAATQRQASEIGYEALTVRPRMQREDAVQPGGTPLAYRRAAKQYFVKQHDKEE